MQNIYVTAKKTEVNNNVYVIVDYCSTTNEDATTFFIYNKCRLEEEAEYSPEVSAMEKGLTHFLESSVTTVDFNEPLNIYCSDTFLAEKMDRLTIGKTKNVKELPLQRALMKNKYRPTIKTESILIEECKERLDDFIYRIENPEEQIAT